MGGYKVQGRLAADIEKLLDDALALHNAGVFAMVLEGIPREVAKLITEQVSAPTLEIGAGPDCDGQVLQYLNGSSHLATALAQFKAECGIRSVSGRH